MMTFTIIFRDVTILERSGRVGGKSNEVNLLGVANTMSTYLFTADYNETVMELAKRFNIYEEGVRWRPLYVNGTNQAAPAFTSQELALLGNWRQTVEEANR